MAGTCPDAITAVDATVEVSFDPGIAEPVWEDISGDANTVEPSEQSRMQGETYTFDCDVGLLTTGKREPVEVTVNVIYLEVVDSVYDKMDAAFKANEKIGVRWFPSGKADGNWMFELNPASLSALQDPTLDAGSADPMVATFTVRAPEAFRSVYVEPAP